LSEGITEGETTMPGKFKPVPREHPLYDETAHNSAKNTPHVRYVYSKKDKFRYRVSKRIDVLGEVEYIKTTGQHIPTLMNKQNNKLEKLNLPHMFSAQEIEAAPQHKIKGKKRAYALKDSYHKYVSYIKSRSSWRVLIQPIGYCVRVQDENFACKIAKYQLIKAKMSTEGYEDIHALTESEYKKFTSDMTNCRFTEQEQTFVPYQTQYPIGCIRTLHELRDFI
jgi:hypothetical protein